MNLNRDVPTVAADNDTIWLKLKGYQKKELSMIGESCVLGDKVLIKQCSVGNNCQFGQGGMKWLGLQFSALRNYLAV